MLMEMFVLVVEKIKSSSYLLTTLLMTVLNIVKK